MRHQIKESITVVPRVICISIHRVRRTVSSTVSIFRCSYVLTLVVQIYRETLCNIRLSQSIIVGKVPIIELGSGPMGSPKGDHLWDTSTWYLFSAREIWTRVGFREFPSYGSTEPCGLNYTAILTEYVSNISSIKSPISLWFQIHNLTIFTSDGNIW